MVLLEKEGYTVRIDNVAWRKGILNLKYKPKLIISPSCQNDLGMNYLTHNYIGAYNGGYMILNLYSEQLASSSAEEAIAISGKALKIYHIAWGKYTYELFRQYGLNDEQVCITGSQKLDYSLEKYNGLNKKKEELAKQFNLDPKKKWIMMVGNFTTEEGEHEYGYYNFDEMIALSNDTCKELIKWYEKVLCDKELKDNIEFIYRPHPNEIVTKELASLCDYYNHFYIIRDYSIADWALNIDLSYIWTSTSAIEISATKTSIVSLTPIKIKKYFELPLVKYIKKITNSDELLEVTKGVLIKNKVIDNHRFYSELEYYCERSKCGASDNIVKFINKIMTKGEYIVVNEFNFFKGTIKFIVYLYEIILYKLNIGLNKYLKVRFEDVRSKKYIDEYCYRIKKCLFEK